MQSEGEALLQQTHNDLIRSLLRALDQHSPGEGGHAERVAVYSTAVGDRMGLEDGDLRSLRQAAQLHDIGKVRINAALLVKPSKLSSAEWDELRLHARLAEVVLESFSEFDAALPSIRHHHERWDGTGYPDGLSGEAIPLGARIIAVAEAYDSLTHLAPFRPACTHDEALEEIGRNAGSHFDPMVVGSFGAIVHLIQPIEG